MRAALATVPGVQKVDVEFERELATVRYNKDKAAGLVPKLVAALEAEGFQSWDVASEKAKPKTP